MYYIFNFFRFVIMKDKNIRSAIILCGGMSRRMGEDKGSMEIDGKPMIIHVLESLNSQIDEAIIVLNDSERIAKYMSLIQEYSNFDFNIKFVEDEIKNKGPLSGIMTGLKTILSDYALVLPCDSPFISSNFIVFMFDTLNKLLESNSDIEGIVPYHSSEINSSKAIVLRNSEPLHSIYKRETYSIIKNLLNSDEKQVKSFISIINSYFIPVDKKDNYSEIDEINFKNINYKNDFKN